MKRRIFSILLLAVVLLTALPMTASADNGDLQNDRKYYLETCPYCGQYIDSGEVVVPTCTKAGYIVFWCENGSSHPGHSGNERNMVKYSFPALGHDLKDVQVTKAAACTASGERSGVCARCGKTVTETVPKLGHTVTQWKIIREATDHSMGEREGKCARCGLAMHEEYYPEGTLKRNDRGSKVKELQQALNEEGRNAGAADGIFGGQTELAVKEAEKELGLEPDGIAWPMVVRRLVGVPKELTLEVKILDGDKGVTPGDTIRLGWKLTNTGKESLFGVQVQMAVGKKKLTLCDNGKKEFKHNGYLEGEWSVKLTQSTYDTYKEAGKIEFTLVGGGKTGKNEKVMSNTVTVPVMLSDGKKQEVGGKTYTPPAVDPDLTLIKYVVNIPEHVTAFAEGEVVEFAIELTNNSKETLYSVRFTDPLYQVYTGLGKRGNADFKKTVCAELKPGEMCATTLYYVVTAEDVKNGSFSNIAYAACRDANSVTRYAESNKVSVPTVPEKLKSDDSAEITKKEVSSPLNGSFYTEGEEVKFDVVLRNSGDDPIHDVTVTDLLKGAGQETDTASSAELTKGAELPLTVTHTVTGDDVTRGKIGNQAMAEWKESGNRLYSDVVTVKTGVDTCPIRVTKTVDHGPSDGSAFCEGESVPYLICVENITGADLTGIDVYDILLETPLAEDIAIAAGKTVVLPMDHKVTHEEAEAGTLTNQAYAVRHNDISGKDEKAYSAPFTVDTALAPGQSMPTLIKEVTSTPANGLFYGPGETVTYDITFRNDTGEAFTDIVLYDILQDDGSTAVETVEEIPAHSMVVFHFSYEVTPEDTKAAGKKLTNIAWANATGEDGSPLTVISDPVSVWVNMIKKLPLAKIEGTLPETDPDPDTVPDGGSDIIMVDDGDPDRETRIPGRIQLPDKPVLTKSVISIPKNGKFYTEGETVEFRIVLENPSYLDLLNVTVYDLLIPDDRYFTTLPIVPAGGSVEMYFDYTVTKADVKAGHVMNAALAECGTMKIVSDKVTVKTGRNMPSVPTADCCVPEATAQLNGVGEYSGHYCALHGMLAMRTAEVIAQAEPDPIEMDALYTGWVNAIDALYDQQLAGADASAAAVISADRTAFYRAVEAYGERTGDTPEQLVMLRDQCAELCYVFHKAPAGRGDLLTAELPVRDDADAPECVREERTLAGRNGRAEQTAADFLCEEHMETAAELWQDIAAGTSGAWERAETVWMAYLDNAYNDLFFPADSAGREAVVADRTRFGELQDAQRELWKLLYPKDEDIAAELAARSAMHRLMTVCGETQN